MREMRAPHGGDRVLPERRQRGIARPHRADDHVCVAQPIFDGVDIVCSATQNAEAFRRRAHLARVTRESGDLVARGKSVLHDEAAGACRLRRTQQANGEWIPSASGREAHSLNDKAVAGSSTGPSSRAVASAPFRSSKTAEATARRSVRRRLNDDRIDRFDARSGGVCITDIRGLESERRVGAPPPDGQSDGAIALHFVTSIVAIAHLLEIASHEIDTRVLVLGADPARAATDRGTATCGC